MHDMCGCFRWQQGKHWMEGKKPDREREIKRVWKALQSEWVSDHKTTNTGLLWLN